MRLNWDDEARLTSLSESERASVTMLFVMLVKCLARMMKTFLAANASNQHSQHSSSFSLSLSRAQLPFLIELE